MDVAQASAVAGQGSAVRIPVVSEQACPATVVEVVAPDGCATTAVVRRPPGDGAFPALIRLHGSLDTFSEEALVAETLQGQTHSRFLAAGYVVVNPTFRARRHDPQSPDALRDCLAVVDYVMALPYVDPRSVVLWGDSGGGSLALEAAAERRLCAIACQEPATILFTGIMSKETLGPGPVYNARTRPELMTDPRRFYTPELRQRTERKIARISCPVFFAYGDVNDINTINHEIVAPALRAVGIELHTKLYPGADHGFSHRRGPAYAKQFFEDAHGFFGRYLPTAPRPLDDSLVAWRGAGPVDFRPFGGPRPAGGRRDECS